MRGLFINNKKAKDSIYESGLMAYQCLNLSKKYILDYVEIDAGNREIKLGYDFYFFNYHHVTMNWLDTAKLKKQVGFVITMILEVSPNDAFVLCPENDFNIYCVLDPTIMSKGNLYSFPRPLEKIDFEIPVTKNEIPVIGTFGFATKGKGFEKVVEAVNKEFQKALVRINIPFGDYVPNSKAYSAELSKICRDLAKPGIEVMITHNFMSKDELIKWCAGNDLNCFLYDRDMPGLSATTDQAIISGRPLSVSDNPTFRHITAFLPPYPTITLKESIEKSTIFVQEMITAWSQQNFVAKFEQIISSSTIIQTHKNFDERILLPVYEANTMNMIKSFLKRIVKKVKRTFF